MPEPADGGLSRSLNQSSECGAADAEVRGRKASSMSQVLPLRRSRASRREAPGSMRLRSRVLRTACVWVLAGLVPAWAATAFGAGATRMRFESGSRSIACDVFGAEKPAATVILLAGTSGPGTEFVRERAEGLRKGGFRVLVPHLFDAARSRVPSDGNYRSWARAVADLTGLVRQGDRGAKVELVGFSLGASVALAAGSQGAPVEAIAEWYGSLPDVFLNHVVAMPPLLILHGRMDTNIPVVNGEQLVRLCGLLKLHCESRFYPDQGHGFSGAALKDADARTLAFLRGSL